MNKIYIVHSSAMSVWTGVWNTDLDTGLEPQVLVEEKERRQKGGGRDCWCNSVHGHLAMLVA